MGRSWKRLSSTAGSGVARPPGRQRKRAAEPVRSDTNATSSSSPASSSVNCALKLTETPSVWQRSASSSAVVVSGDCGTATEKTSKPKLVTPTDAKAIVPVGWLLLPGSID